MRERAIRYKEKDGQNRSLYRFIVETLPYLDFKTASAFYADIEKSQDNDAYRKAISYLGCNDRFFLLTTLLGRKDAYHPWLYERCREVEANPDGYLDLWSRFHYKSTIITFAGIIQELLVDPEITVAVFSHTKDIARPFVKQIKAELENNTLLQALYSDVLYRFPQNDSPSWSENGIVVKRKSNPKECTVEPHGLDAQPTSRHFDLLVYDDIVTEKNAKIPEQIKKTTVGWENSDNLGKPHGTRKWHAGTRWGFGDTYGIMLEDKRLKPRIYPATDDGTLKGRPVFLTPKRWAEIKSAQKSTVSAQMLLNPVAGNDAMFVASWFKSYDVIPNVLNVYIVCDPSKGKGKDSDRTAIAVIGVDPAGNKYLLDGVRHRMRLSTRYDFLKRFYSTWVSHPGVQACKVGYEIYGAQADTEVIEEYQQRDRQYFEVNELNYPRQGPHSKEARVERLEPDMKSGRFYLPAVVHHPDIGGRDGKCLWTVWTDEHQKKWDEQHGHKEGDEGRCPYHVDQVIYRPLNGPTKMERWCEASGQFHRIVRPLKRFAEDKEIYDLTRAFMQEAMMFPFTPHDDLVDAISRVFDMEICLPVQYEASALSGGMEDDYLGLPEEGVGADQQYDA